MARKRHYKHPRGRFAKRGKWYYGNSRKLSLRQIRAYQWRKRRGRK